METPASVRDDGSYFSYLLRLWREDGGWRASLENIGADRRTGFASLEMLFEYLRQETMNPVPARKETTS